MKKLGIIFGVIIALVIVLFTFVGIKTVDSSEVGIEFKKFSLTEQGETIASPCSGVNIYNRMTTSIFTYPVFVQRKDYAAFTVTTKDAANFAIDPVIAYQLQKDRAVDVFKKYRKSLEEIENGYMRTVIYDAYRLTANKYTSDELMSHRAEFESGVRAMLENSLNNEGFTVQEFTSTITPPASLQNAINAKNQSVQESLKAEIEVRKAEAQAKIEIAKAEGNAKAMKIKADAEAYYNKTIAASLSDKIVLEDAIERWNGVLPTVMGNSGNILDLKNIIK